MDGRTEAVETEAAELEPAELEAADVHPAGAGQVRPAALLEGRLALRPFGSA